MKKKLHYFILTIGLLSSVIVIGLRLYKIHALKTGYTFYGLLDVIYYWLTLIVFIFLIYVCISIIVFHYNNMTKRKRKYTKIVTTIEGILVTVLTSYALITVMTPIFMLSYYDTKAVYKGKTYVVRVHFWLDHSFDYYSDYTNTLIPLKPDFHAIMHDEYEKDYRNHLGNEKAIIILDH